jgi:PAS domain S-box-containing protein
MKRREGPRSSAIPWPLSPWERRSRCRSCSCASIRLFRLQDLHYRQLRSRFGAAAPSLVFSQSCLRRSLAAISSDLQLLPFLGCFMILCFLVFALLMIRLTRSWDELEVKVAERTAELTAANEKLKLEIAERKRVEAQSRTLIDAIPQQIWSGPPDGTLDYCNERWRSEKGLGLEELQGEGWQSMLHPGDRHRVLKAWHHSVTTGTAYEQEERHRGADGIYRWFLARGIPLRDGKGRIVRRYGTNTDIEDRKNAEEDLRRLSGQLLQLQDEERRRMARELHDSTGQDLVALATMLGQLRTSIPSVERKSRRLLSQCSALADKCIRVFSGRTHPLCDAPGNHCRAERRVSAVSRAE